MPRISALPSASTAAGPDEFPIVQGAVTKRLSFSTAQAAGLFLPANNSITTAKLADNSVTSDKLQASPSIDLDRAVTTNHIQDVAVTTQKIADQNVTTAKLADASVTSPKIASGALTIAKFATSDKTFIENAASSRPGSRVITSGSVEDIVLYEPGTGYTSVPTITITPSPTGDTATATCTLVSGSVASITITNPGSGYTINPTVTFTSSPGTTAKAYAYSITSGLSCQDEDNGGSYASEQAGFFITSDKKVKVVGYNNYSKNATGSSGTSSVLPEECMIYPPNSNDPVKPFKVYAKYSNTHMIDTKGRVYSCGYGGNNGNGLNTTGNIYFLYQISSSFFNNKPVVKLAFSQASSSNTCFALTADGKVYGWGYNYNGELGNGTNSQAPVPTPVASGYTISDIAFVGTAGSVASYLIEAGTGRVLAAGNNNQGELGLGYFGGNAYNFSYVLKSPGNILGSGSEGKVIKIVGGGGGTYNYVYFLTENGKVYSIGYGGFGQLGTGGNTTNFATESISSGAVSVHTPNYSERYGFGFVIKNDGTVWGTGYNGYYNLGTGNSTNQNPWVKLWDPAVNGILAKKILCTSSGYPNAYSSTILLSQDGRLFGVGYNGYSMLGEGSSYTVQPSWFEAYFNRGNSTIVDMRLDSYADLSNPRILMSDGKVYSVGYGGNYQLGNANNGWRGVYSNILF